MNAAEEERDVEPGARIESDREHVNAKAKPGDQDLAAASDAASTSGDRGPELEKKKSKKKASNAGTAFAARLQAFTKDRQGQSMKRKRSDMLSAPSGDAGEAGDLIERGNFDGIEQSSAPDEEVPTAKLNKSSSKSGDDPTAAEARPQLKGDDDGEAEKAKSDYTIVVARYNESIDWLWPEMQHSIVYNKGSALGIPNEVPLPNVGRESHTYLTYVIEHYHQLPDIVVFTQARIRDHCFCEEIDYVRQLRDQASVNGKSDASVKKGTHPNGCWRPDWNRTVDARGNEHWYHGPTENPGVYFNDRPIVFQDWFTQHIQPEYPLPTSIYENAIFAVRREYITRHPLEDYRRLLHLVSYHRNPIEGHFFERSWYYIF